MSWSSLNDVHRVGMCQLLMPTRRRSPSCLTLRSGSLGAPRWLALCRVTWVNLGGPILTQDFQTRANSPSLRRVFLTSHTLPFRDMDGKSHKTLPLGVENDRVFNDLWGKGNMPVVLNNPYSEKEQVSSGASLAQTTLGREMATVAEELG